MQKLNELKNKMLLKNMHTNKEFKMYWLKSQDVSIDSPEYFVHNNEMFIRKFFIDSTFPDAGVNETQYVKIEGYEHLLEGCQTID